MKNNSKSSPDNALNTIKRLQESVLILLAAFAVFILIALTTYPDRADPLTLSTRFTSGSVGIWIAHYLYLVLGYAAYCFAVATAYLGLALFQAYHHKRPLTRIDIMMKSLGLLFFTLSSACLFYLLSDPHILPFLYGSGGIAGMWLTHYLILAFGLSGTLLFVSTLFLTTFTIMTGLSWFTTLEAIGRISAWMMHWAVRCLFQLASWFYGIMALVRQYIYKRKSYSVTMKSVLVPKKNGITSLPVLTQTKVTGELSVPLKKEKVVSPPIPKKAPVTGALPSLNLLDKIPEGAHDTAYPPQILEQLSREVEQNLLDFGVQADVVAVHPGPVITRFELQLAAGIKVSRLSGLAKDLARSLSVTSVRVVEVIPGKTVVGLELPNEHRMMVRLSQVLESDVYQHALSPLALALGVDIAGHPVVVDLAKMPHLLVAGTTGSGKSVGINAMILSLLFRATPEQVRLIMVDPKMLELSVYAGVPHLLTPVVTDMKEAASALRWCVGEMERRYRLMAAMGVRNLAGFNTKIEDARVKGEYIADPLYRPVDGMMDAAPVLEKLPYIVVVIDELADMMMVVGKKVEQLIARIAQKARAAGIHLILATQRPSVDVLTGLIKSNIPTRISFQVSSKIDSRTILDQQGAESLLGHGDMLYLAPGTGAPFRVHGAFVDDEEVHRIAEDWRQRGEPCYVEEITQCASADNELTAYGEENEAIEDTDPLYDQAVEFVTQSRKASISAVQRRFKIGYNRAARLIEEMERVGLVGPLEGGVRDVLVKVEET